MAETINEAIKRKLAVHAGHLTKALRLRLGAEGKNASRKLSDSIQGTVTITPALAILRGFAMDYWKYVDQGRRPGKMPPEAPIIRWIKQKGIAEGLTKKWQLRSLAYVIRRKIAKEGIAPTNIFTEETDKLQEKLEGQFSTDIADAIQAKGFEVLQPKHLKKQFKGI